VRDDPFATGAQGQQEKKTTQPNVLEIHQTDNTVKSTKIKPFNRLIKKRFFLSCAQDHAENAKMKDNPK
jgi:hypothetical protein